MAFSRRHFNYSACATLASDGHLFALTQASCSFKLAVINDEISPDFDHACSVVAVDFGMKWIELRTLWGKTLASLTAAELADATKILEKYQLRVTDIASPLFKTDLPGAPLSKESPTRDQFKAEFTYKEQEELLERCIALAKTFKTDRIRCFDFWRLENQKPYRAEINRKLSEAADKCARNNIVLVLENEMACNTGSGVEAASTLGAIPNRNLMLNWDPGNSGSFADDVPYPNDYDHLPKGRIGHVHCKNVKRAPGSKRGFEWQPVDAGLVDWVGQFKALKRDGYKDAVSLETHWQGGGSPEASTRISFAGMRKCLTAAGIGC